MIAKAITGGRRPPVNNMDSSAAAQARLELGLISLLNILLFSGVCFGWASVNPPPLPAGATPRREPIAPAPRHATPRHDTPRHATTHGHDPPQVRLMLESEGVIAPAEAERTYSIIFSVAAFLVNGISVPSGILLDKAGAACTAAVAGGCMAVGLVGFGMAESPATLTVSYALIAVGGQMTLFGE